MDATAFPPPNASRLNGAAGPEPPENQPFPADLAPLWDALSDANRALVVGPYRNITVAAVVEARLAIEMLRAMGWTIDQMKALARLYPAGLGRLTAATLSGVWHDAAPPPAFLPFQAFLATFTNPDYVIDGIIQRGRLHALTSPTGHGKTAVALYLSALIATGRNLGNIEVEQGSVAFLAGENPDDFCGRCIATAQHYGMDPARVPVTVLPGNFPLTPDRVEAVKQQIDAMRDPPSLIVVDSAAAYFDGDNENDNVQAGCYARSLRVLTTCQGRPAVLVLCHPVKNPSRDNLLPRGGGAFLAEVDCNLTLWANTPGEPTTLHWLGKFRGPDFSPVTFALVEVRLIGRTNKKGVPHPSVVATLQTGEEAERQEDKAITDENTVLEWLRREPGISVAKIATSVGWASDTGAPNKAKVHRLMRVLQGDKLVRLFRRQWRITDAGKKALERGADA